MAVERTADAAASAHFDEHDFDHLAICVAAILALRVVRLQAAHIGVHLLHPAVTLFKASASFGVTTTALSGYDLAKMLSHADKMLYRAKRGGRNRVFVYEVPVPVQLPVPVGGAHDEPAPVPDAVEQTGDTSDGVAAEERSPQQRVVAVS